MPGPFASALERHSLLSSAEEGAAVFSPANVLALSRAVRALPEGEAKEAEKAKLRSIIESAKSMRGQAKAPLAQAGFDPEDKARFREAVFSKAPAEPSPTAFQRLTTALDVPLRGVRFLAESAAGIPGESYKKGEDFHAAIVREAEAGNPVAKAIDTSRGAGLGVTLGTIAGWVPQLKPYKPLLQIGGVALGAALSPALPEATKRIGFDLAADPLNLVKTVGAADTMAKHLTELGADSAKAAEFAKTWAAKPGAFFQENYPAFLEEASKLGPSAEALTQRFGATGEWLGRTETGLGLGEKVATLGQAPARAVNKVATKAGRAIGVLEEGGTFAQRQAQARTQAALGRQARATETTLRDAIAQDAVGVAKLSNGIEPARQSELIARFLDPGIADKAGGSIAGLKPAEQNFLTALDNLFGKYKSEVEALGVKAERNARSALPGGYYPRAFGDAFGRGGDAEALMALLKERAARQAEHGVSAPSLKARTADVAWGDVIGPGGVPTEKAAGLAARADLAPDIAKDLSSYGRQLSGAKSYLQLKQALERNFADASGKLNPQAEQFLTDSFDNLTRAMEAKVGQWRNPDGSTIMDKAMKLAAESLDTFHRLFKVNNLVYRLPYHAANVFGDSTMMAVHGINPVAAWTEARDLMRAAAAKDPAALKLLEQARANNIGLATPFDRLEFSSLTKAGQEEARLRKAGGQSLGLMADVMGKVGDAVGRVPGVGKLPRISEVWEQYAKLGTFLDGMKRGLSPEQAAERTFQVLLDYGQPGKSGIQNVVLFWNYLSQAAKASSKALAERPAAWIAPQKVAKGISDRESGAPARWMEEAGPAVALGPRAKALASSARQALGGDPFDADTFISPRFGHTEGLGLPLALVDSALDATGSASVPQATIRLARFASPPIKYLAETVTGRDSLTGGQRDPGPAAGLGAAEIPVDAALRVALPALLPSPVQAGANTLIAAAGGPATLIGRPDSIDPRPQNAPFAAAFGQISPWQPREVTPTTRYYETANSPQAVRYKAELERVKKNMRERRQRARLDKRKTQP